MFGCVPVGCRGWCRTVKHHVTVNCSSLRHPSCTHTRRTSGRCDAHHAERLLDRTRIYKMCGRVAYFALVNVHRAATSATSSATTSEHIKVC